MSRKHPASETLRRFIEGGLSEAEVRAVVRHLLGGCARCRRTARGFFARPGGAGEAGAEIDFRRVAKVVRAREVSFSREKEAAPHLLASLLRHPPARRGILVRNSKSYQTLALCQEVLKAAFEAGFREPQEAVELAELGLTMAKRLDSDRYGAESVFDQQASAWATLGNAKRIVSDFRGAEKAFQAAEEALASGTQDPLDRARLGVLRAHLYASLRQFDEAFPLFDQSIAAYRRLGETHREGCALADKGLWISQDGDVEEAIEVLHRSLSLIDSAREPRRALAVKHNLLVAYHRCARYAEASRLLEEVRSLHHALGNPIDLVRFRWLEGQLAAERGDLAEAEKVFKAVQAEFADREMATDAAQASLELAKIYLEQGRLSEIHDLAAHMLTVFRTLGVHREALAAVMLFQEAAEQERLSLSWLSSLGAYLERAQKNQALRFIPE